MSTEFVVIAFSLANGLRVLAYVPQLLMLMRDRTGAPGVSCTTWTLFLAAHLTTVLYAAVELRDPVMVAIFALNAVCCAGIVVLLVLRRRRPVPARPRLEAAPTATVLR